MTPGSESGETEKGSAEKGSVPFRAPVEFPNAWIKQKLGLRRFATRGLPKVGCEALWAALTYNLQRAFRLAPELALSR